MIRDVADMSAAELRRAAKAAEVAEAEEQADERKRRQRKQRQIRHLARERQRLEDAEVNALRLFLAPDVNIIHGAGGSITLERAVSGVMRVLTFSAEGGDETTYLSVTGTDI